MVTATTLRRGGRAWSVKLRRYHDLGVRELVRFDPDEVEEQRLRIWDRVGGELVERVAGGEERRRCHVLKLYWVVVATGRLPLTLRLARDAEGRDLVLTPEETAERRIAELEAALRRKNG